MLIPSAVIHKLAPPAPAGTLLEGFEQVPLTGLYVTWDATNYGGGSPTVARTTSNVTQGTYSWRVNGAASVIIGALQFNDGYDISSLMTGKTQIKVDIFISTLNVSDRVALQITDNNSGNFDNIESSPGASGAITLTLNLSTVTDFTNCAIFIGAYGNGQTPLNGAFDIYIDNLRAT